MIIIAVLKLIFLIIVNHNIKKNKPTQFELPHEYISNVNKNSLISAVPLLICREQ